MGYYSTRYVHKISPQPGDAGPSLSLSQDSIADRLQLGARLRDARILSSGQAIRDFRIESSGRIVVFPKGGQWHSIVLDPIPREEFYK